MTSTRPIAVIVNTRCRANRKDPAMVERLRRGVGEQGLFFATANDESLIEAATRIHRAQPSTLAIHGGDGTLHLTMTRVIQAYGGARLPRIVVLRGGTQNTIANACGIAGQAERVLQNAVARHHAGAPFVELERDILRIGPAPSAHEPRGASASREDLYGFIFGNGFVHQFLAEYYSRGEPSQWNALVTLAVGCASIAVRGAVARRMFRRFHGRVTVDGEVWPATDFTGVVGSTIEQVGLGFRPFVRCDERPGTFHLLGITTGALGFALELPSIRLGLPLNERKILNGVFRSAVFEAEESLDYMVDGDIRAARHRLELGVGPRVRFVVR